MSNPIIMRELQDRKRVMTARYGGSEDGQMYSQELWHDMAVAGYKRGERPRDAVQFLKRLLPFIRFQEESMREYEAQEKAGGRTICPRCGERSVRDSLVATLGGGLPGSEYSVYYKCERDECDYAEL